MAIPEDNRQISERAAKQTAFDIGLDELVTIWGKESPFKKVFTGLLKEVLKAIPGVSTGIGIHNVLTQGIATIEAQESQRRLQGYMLGIGEHLENTNFDMLELREEDIIPVIRKLAADDEAAKTEYYTRLTVKLCQIPLSELSHDLRYHFIRLVSSLTCYQIEFARKLKVFKTVPIRGTESFEHAELAHTGQESGMVMQAVRALENAGLLKESGRPLRLTVPKGKLYDTTAEFDTLMELLFHRADFEPESLSLEAKTTCDVIMVGQRVFIDDLYATYLPEILKRKGVNIIAVDSDNLHLQTYWAPLYLHTTIEQQYREEFIHIVVSREGHAPSESKADRLINHKVNAKGYDDKQTLTETKANEFRNELDFITGRIVELVKADKTAVAR